jgi:hypothetical protein
MKEDAMRLLLLAPALLLAAPAMAADYALLGPRFAAGKQDGAEAKAVIARARAALSRPPGAIPQLHTEGTLPGKGIREISLKAKQDQPIMLDLAMAWRLTGDRAFRDQVGRYLDDWARVYQLSFNPIDETGFDRMAMACDLVEADLPRATRNRLDDFWRRMAIGYLDAMDAGPKNAGTNWQSHRIKLATMAAFRTGDAGLIARARDAYRKQVASNLRPDGSTFDFEERDALHYVTYDLEPLAMAALTAKMHGEDWYGWTAPDGASLPKSLDWLVPYAQGTKTHIEFVNSKIQFDRDRAGAGQDEYAPHPWKPGAALDLYCIASLLDPRFGALSDTLAAQSKRGPEAWVTLFGAR